jgi:hypothetical protein
LGTEDTPTVPLIVTRIEAATVSFHHFVVQYCRFFGNEVVFLPTEGVQPPGRRVRFVFALADGTDLVTGEGIVLRMRRDSGDPLRPAGMELRYQVLDEESQHVVDALLQMRNDPAARAWRPEPPPYVWMHVETPPSRTAPIAIGSASGEIRVSQKSIPANPFAGVADVTLEQFVDGAIARAHGRRSWWRGRRWTQLGAGMATGAAVLALAGTLGVLRRQRSSVVVPSAQATAAPVAVPVHAPAVAPAHAPAPVAAAAAIPIHAPAAVPAHAPAAAPVHAPAAGVVLSISTSPSGSTVFVDGEARGPSPLALTVAPGAHDVVAERPRYATAHAHVEPGASRVQLIHERPPATLRVVSIPPGAKVRLDGRSVGVAPIELPCTGYEFHRVQVELEGRTVRRRIYVKPPTALFSVDGGARTGRPSIDQPRPVRVAHDLRQ